MLALSIDSRSLSHTCHAKCIDPIACVYMLDSNSEKLASIDAVFGALPAPEKAARGFVDRRSPGADSLRIPGIPTSISHVNLNHVHLAAYSMYINACYRKHACIAP